MAAKTAIDQVYAPGIDLVKNDPPRATDLLSKAWQQLDAAAAAGIPASAIDPLRAQARTGLDQLYKMRSGRRDGAVLVRRRRARRSTCAASLGPDRAPYVLDAATNAVYRDRRQGRQGHARSPGPARSVARDAKLGRARSSSPRPGPTS